MHYKHDKNEYKGNFLSPLVRFVLILCPKIQWRTMSQIKQRAIKFLSGNNKIYYLINYKLNLCNNCWKVEVDKISHLIIVDNVYKGLVLSFVSRYWSRRFDRTLWSKRRGQYQSDNRETNDKTKPFINKICDFLVFPFSTNIRYSVTLVVQELPSFHLFWCLRNRWSCVPCVKITWVSNRSCWILNVNDVYRLLR